MVDGSCNPMKALSAQKQSAVEKRLHEWMANDFVNRMWRKDPTIWSSDGSPSEIVDRLGWLSLPESMQSQISDIAAFAQEARNEGCRHVVLLGMGGSSLAPAVLQDTFGGAPGNPELIALDSTHPAAVKAVDSKIDPLKTLFLVSSKSGTTLETLSLFAYFWDRTNRLSPNPGRNFVAITDPGTSLVQMAKDRGFRRIFLAPEDVGGRYSALSVFGIVPAALIGVNIEQMLNHASRMAEACRFASDLSQNPGSILGAILGELGAAGQDKITFITGKEFSLFPLWLEQLIAESTGKNGRGLIPIAGETPGKPESYGNDRLFIGITLSQSSGQTGQMLDALQAAGHPVIRINLSERIDLGLEMFRWEFATAAAGAILQINPFDQPDVQLAKDLARKAMERSEKEATQAGEALTVLQKSPLSNELKKLTGGIQPGDYLAFQAYLDPNAQISDELEKLRNRLRDRLHIATTVGFGPRFLHSTGQLHKGGPNKGIFIQLVDQVVEDLQVPGKNYSFGKLIRAQAEGDFQALQNRGRRAIRINLGENASAGIAELASLVNGLLR
jgi:transaldolase / glucose-6-phosphate isomerase